MTDTGSATGAVGAEAQIAQSDPTQNFVDDLESVIDEGYLDLKMSRAEIVDAFIRLMAEIPDTEEPLSCEQCKREPIRYLMIVDWTGKLQHLGRRKMLVGSLCKDYNMEMQGVFRINEPSGPRIFIYGIQRIGEN